MSFQPSLSWHHNANPNVQTNAFQAGIKRLSSDELSHPPTAPRHGFSGSFWVLHSLSIHIQPRSPGYGRGKKRRPMLLRWIKCHFPLWIWRWWLWRERLSHDREIWEMKSFRKKDKAGIPFSSNRVRFVRVNNQQPDTWTKQLRNNFHSVNNVKYHPYSPLSGYSLLNVSEWIRSVMFCI